MELLAGVLFFFGFLVLMLAIGGFLLKVALQMVASVETSLGHAMMTVLFYTILSIVSALVAGMVVVPATGGMGPEGEISPAARVVISIITFFVAAGVIKSRYELTWGRGLLTALAVWLLSMLLGLVLGLVIGALVGGAMVAAS